MCSDGNAAIGRSDHLSRLRQLHVLLRQRGRLLLALRVNGLVRVQAADRVGWVSLSTFTIITFSSNHGVRFEVFHQILRLLLLLTFDTFARLERQL